MDRADLVPTVPKDISNEFNALHSEAIVQSSDDAIISKTLEGNIVSWNPGAQAMFGYSAQEIIGKPILLLLPPDRVSEEEQILTLLKAGIKVEHFETVRVRKDGTLIDISATISPIYDSEHQVIGISKIAREITVRKQTETRLHLAASVFAHASEGILITDRNGLILEVNDAFTSITGYAHDEVVGQTTQFLRSSQHGPAFYAALIESLVRVGHWRGEVWSRHKNGQAYASALTISAVRDSQGRLEHYLALCSDITPLRQQQQKMAYVAQYDPLTGLPNRLLLSQRLQQAMIQSRRHGESVAVLYLDLDGFERINATWGHEVGDQLLVAIAQRMKQAMRVCDTLARFGGDEFVGILTGVRHRTGCEPLLDQLLQIAAGPVRIGVHELQVSASIGVTLYPQDDAVADQLLRHADQAMYQAKLAGRNRYEFFDIGIEQAGRHRSEGAGQIIQALEHNEFVLHYQPKVNMKTGQVVGVEALIRWQHPQRGLLMPGAFLPMVEDHPVSVALGEWVIKTALAQMTSWQSGGLDMDVSVNVGSRQLQDDEFVLRLSALLAAQPRFRKNSLELEILETRALDDMVRISNVMHACCHIGVRFALDDFGTGYSTLTYLKQLPAATLKIDQSFIRGMLDDSDDLAIVEGVIGLAKAFRRDLIAEGVETLAHGALLLTLDCDQAQGYVIAHPMPADALPAWVAHWRPDPAWTVWLGHAPDRNDVSLALVEVELRHWLRDIDAYLTGKNVSSQFKTSWHMSDTAHGQGKERIVRSYFGTMPAFAGALVLDDRLLVLTQQLVAAHDAGRAAEARDCLMQMQTVRDELIGLLRTLVQGMATAASVPGGVPATNDPGLTPPL